MSRFHSHYFGFSPTRDAERLLKVTSHLGTFCSQRLLTSSVRVSVTVFVLLSIGWFV